MRALTFELGAPPRGEDAHARTREGAGRPPGSVILFLGQVQRQLPDLSIYRFSYSFISIYLSFYLSFYLSIHLSVYISIHI